MGSSAPQRFGPYVVIDRIGDGGMAEIFLAKMQGYSGFEKLVALKKIHPRYSQNQTFARMLIHEAKLAATLNHFNVVQVHDLGEIDGQVYIAMEYVHGKDLAAVLSNTYRRRERLPINLALCVATEFITGLDYAHRMRSGEGKALGIIHRDISPQNVLISHEGEVKLTDFGIARVLSEKEDGFHLPGNLHGKFGYMSPEQVRGHEIDQRSDIFSSGVVLWEMLTGRRLFRGKEHKETIKMIVSLAIPLPSSINPEVPPAVDQICMKALARDRNQRYQTIGALLGELSRVADDLPERAATRDLSVYMRRQFGPGIPGFGIGRPGYGRTDRPSPHGGDKDLQVSDFHINSGDRAPLGQLLMEQGSLSSEDLEIALAEQRARGGRIGDLLVASGTVNEDDLVTALSAQANVPSLFEADLLGLPAPEKLLQRFPREAAEATLILPISINEEQRSVGLAVNDPYDERAILETKVVLGVNDVVPFVAPRTAIRAAIGTWYEPEPEDEGFEILSEVSESPVFEGAVEVLDGRPLVLIADGEQDLAEALAERVREEDCEVVVATGGKHARDVCRQARPTVAFFDAALPGIDGYNLLLELRSRNEDAAVFLTSSRGEEFRQAKALELGADDFIVKPYSIEVMTSKIRREIRRRSEQQNVRAPTVRFDGVSGSLKDMTALDIVQGLELGRKTAHVVLQYEDGRNGELRVDQGHVRGAVMGDEVSGEVAFYALTGHGEGLFRIEYRTSSVPNNIVKPNTYLMIEAMRRLDERQPPAATADPGGSAASLGRAVAAMPPSARVPRSSMPAPAPRPGGTTPRPRLSASLPAGDVMPRANAPAPAPAPRATVPRPGAGTPRPTVSPPAVRPGAGTPRPTVSPPAVRPGAGTPRPTVSPPVPRPGAGTPRPTVSTPAVRPGAGTPLPKVSGLVSRPGAATPRPGVSPSAARPGSGTPRPTVSASVPRAGAGTPRPTVSAPAVRPGAGTPRPTVSAPALRSGAGTPRPTVSAPAVRPGSGTPLSKVSGPVPRPAGATPRPDVSPSAARPGAGTPRPTVSAPVPRPGAGTPRPTVSPPAVRPGAGTPRPTVSPPAVRPGAGTPRPNVSAPVPRPSEGASRRLSPSSPAAAGTPLPNVSSSVARPAGHTPRPKVSAPVPRAGAGTPRPTVSPSAARPGAGTPRPTVSPSAARPGAGTPRPTVSAPVSDPAGHPSRPHVSGTAAQPGAASPRSRLSPASPTAGRTPRPNVVAPAARPGVGTPRPRLSSPSAAGGTPRPHISAPDPRATVAPSSASGPRPPAGPPPPPLSPASPGEADPRRPTGQSSGHPSEGGSSSRSTASSHPHAAAPRFVPSASKPRERPTEGRPSGRTPGGSEAPPPPTARPGPRGLVMPRSQPSSPPLVAGKGTPPMASPAKPARSAPPPPTEDDQRRPPVPITLEPTPPRMTLDDPEDPTVFNEHMNKRRVPVGRMPLAKAPRSVVEPDDRGSFSEHSPTP